MTTVVVLDDTGRVYLRTGHVLDRIGLGLTAKDLHHWIHGGAITPAQPPTGTGSNTGWSHHDFRALDAIARVRSDLISLNLPCTQRIVAELWDQLDTADTATIRAGTVQITVHLDDHLTHHPEHQATLRP